MEHSGTIKVFRGQDCWLAWFKGPAGTEMKALFGTDVIPTAYTTRASEEEVVAGIQKLNPQHKVFGPSVLG